MSLAARLPSRCEHSLIRRALPASPFALIALMVLGCGGSGAPPDEGGSAGESAAEAEEVGASQSAIDNAGDPVDAGPGTVGGARPVEGAGGAEDAAVAPTPGDGSQGALTTLSGIVGLTGTAEMQLLTLRNPRGAWLLQGEVADELRRLDGATVEVTGHAAGAPGGRMRAFDVESYALLLVAGGAPFVGRVGVAEDGGPTLILEDVTLRLSGADDLDESVGALVWVLGQRSGQTLTVGSYGILRPPP